MILTEQQKQQVIEFLKKRVGNTSCPECQNADLKIGDRLTALCTMTEENKAHPVEFYRLVPLTCHFCGYVRLFDAKAVGIVK